MDVAFPSNIPTMNIEALQTNPMEKEWTGPFTFIQGADTQFGMINTYLDKKTVPNWDKEIILTTQAIEKINSMNPKPKFFVVCGDMLDAMPYPGILQVRNEQYTDFVRLFQKLDPEIKLICVCGNHDIGDEPTKETVEIYRKQFGPDFFTFWCSGVKFVVLNSQYFKTPQFVPEEVARQASFMETIADADAKHIVVFQHIPFFLNEPEEEADYFTIDKPQRIALLNKLRDAGVRHIFCGHYHRNAGGYYKEIQQVVTSAVGCQLGDDRSGFRVVNVHEDKITHEYVRLEDDSTKKC